VGKLKTNQDGFGAVEALLILVIVAIVGFTGWYVWQAKSKTDKALTVNNSSTPSFKKKTTPAAVPAPPADPTASWTSYTSSTGKFSLKYPQTWVAASNPNPCTGDLILLGPTASSVGKCGSENQGEVSVGYSGHGCFPLDSSFSSVTTEKVTVAGVAGERDTGTSINTGAFFGLPANTKVIQYCIGTGQYVYDATYAQQPGYPDASSDFDTVITKTFKIN
jgi:hypothetical protein